MEWVETTARSVQEAKERAIDMLGVAGDEAEFEVIEEASRGLLGFGRTDARVRARVRPTQPRAKVERRGRGRGRGGPGDRQRGGRSRGGRGRGGGQGSGSKATDSKATDSKDRRSDGASSQRSGSKTAGSKADKGQPGRRGAGGGQRKSRGRGSGDGPKKAATGDRDGQRGPQGGSQGARPQDDRRGGSQGARPQDDRPQDDRPQDDERQQRRRSESSNRGRNAEAKARAKEQESTMSESSDETVDARQQAEAVVPFLEDLLVAFDLEGTVRTEVIDDDTVEVQVEGDDLGLLIGPRGNTLRSVQELSRTVVQRRHPGRLDGRVRVDVSGYQRRRKEALEAFTRKLAEGVRSSGQEKALEPMSASDRKIVHDTVVDIDGVRTASEGEEPHRRVILIPEDS